MRAPTPASTALVFDTMLLSHFALADRIDVLRDLHAGTPCYTTRVVCEELRAANAQLALAKAEELDWLEVKRLDTLEELRAFVTWTERLGSGDRDRGEASIFATAELQNAVALTDDREAVSVGRRHGLDVHGTLWLLSRACRKGELTEVNVASLVDALRHTGMRLPCSGGEYPSWARKHKLLP
ncbi:DUF3368 domain-containing protein [Actinomadura parmotrematis]|uniref:DUF3368 domain-containing protein n=1 Tax=Actinomadura parmotrematis TaxID=2864039 RepID=A0ABS7FV23_9ACTN|nr:DUF3368 domain-containing protein [Actinomadura parmotrematis]MBW8484273.1 DUF3368 domain-containing protein [Actinomadura parmotrematis]